MSHLFVVQAVNGDKYIGELRNAKFKFQDRPLNPENIKIINLGYPCGCRPSCRQPHGSGNVELTDGSAFKVTTWRESVGFLKTDVFSNLWFDFDLYCESLNHTVHFGRWEVVSFASIDKNGRVARSRGFGS